MSTKLQYRVNTTLKKEYDNFVEEKHGNKHGKCGKSIENLMKLELTAEGASDYSDDPDVQELLEAAKKTPCTHTHRPPDKDDDHDVDSNFDDDEYLEARVNNAIAKQFDDFKKEMKEAIQINIQQGIKKELENNYTYNIESPNNHKSMEFFIQSFIEQYGEWTQVSYKELAGLAVQAHGVSDKRSIQNRVNYLIGKGILKESVPNIYNIIQ